jgi:hypothetical protein
MTEVPPRNARHTLKVLMRDTGRWVKKINEISARRRYFYCFSDSTAMAGITRREKNAVIRTVIRAHLFARLFAQ